MRSWVVDGLVVPGTVVFFLSVVSINPIRDKRHAKVVAARRQINQFENALRMYKDDTGAFPATEQGLDALRVKPEDVINWDGPYLVTDIPLDPWGNAFVYHLPGPQIISYAADGKPGGTEVGRTPWSAGDPLVAVLHLRIPFGAKHYTNAPEYRRHLPHIFDLGQPVFVTWRLFGSLPPNRAFPDASVNSGKAFATMDLLPDQGASGPLHLKIPAIADMIVEAILYNSDHLRHYELSAYLVMPNHVHLLTLISLPKLTKSLKGITAKRASQMLGLTGCPFWREESYDHLVSNDEEFYRIRNYIEENPVRAGFQMVERVDQGAAADQGVRPTADDGS